MASNKHALIRYRVIDKCLRRVDQAWNWESLGRECSLEIEKNTGKPTTLSQRTIKGDIQSMRNDSSLGYYAPIEYDRKEKSYYYSRSGYSITESPLNKSDSEELKNVINLLHQYTGFQHLAGIENIIQKLELLAYESTKTTKKIVHLAQPDVIPGQKWLDPLYEAIKQEKAVSIQYQPFGKEVATYIISPYLLKEYSNRWYLYAEYHQKSELRTFGLERIVNITPSLQEYKASENFNADNYFRDIIGITLEPNQVPLKIQFEVYNRTVNYIRTKPLHHTQKEISSTTECTLFEMTLIPNFELQSLLLSFGENLKVIAPKELAGKMQKRALGLAAIYS